jgi:hypothetical protein
MQDSGNSFPISKFRPSLLIPFGKKFIENNRHLFHEKIRCLFARRIDFVHNIDGSFQAVLVLTLVSISSFTVFRLSKMKPYIALVT